MAREQNGKGNGKKGKQLSFFAYGNGKVSNASPLNKPKLLEIQTSKILIAYLL